MVQIVEFQREFTDALAATLRIMRLARGMSQEQFAAAAGVAYGSVRAWEDGRNLPSLHHLYRLCKVLRMELWRFMRAVELKQSTMPPRLPGQRLRKPRSKVRRGHTVAVETR